MQTLPMLFDCFDRALDSMGDLPIVQTFGNEAQDLDFAPSQPSSGLSGDRRLPNDPAGWRADQQLDAFAVNSRRDSYTYPALIAECRPNFGIRPGWHTIRTLERY